MGNRRIRVISASDNGEPHIKQGQVFNLTLPCGKFRFTVDRDIRLKDGERFSLTVTRISPEGGEARDAPIKGASKESAFRKGKQWTVDVGGYGLRLSLSDAVGRLRRGTKLHFAVRKAPQTAGFAKASVRQ
jgi:hypothetical protein